MKTVSNKKHAEDGLFFWRMKRIVNDKAYGLSVCYSSHQERCDVAKMLIRARFILKRDIKELSK